jgi:alginate O-acetyltransferase complex protein AlgI
MPVKNYIAGILERKGGAFATATSVWGPRLLALALLALSYLKLVTGTFNPFIYFRF